MMTLESLKRQQEELLAMSEVKELVGPKRFRLRSTFLVALAIFVCANAFLSFFMPIPFDIYKFNYRGWSWWTFNALREEKQVSNVVLLGSSTMVSALAGCDANYLQKGLDLTRHHHSRYLEDRLKKNIAGDIDIFSLAAPGQMPSDAYITLKAMVASATRPDVVIYGVAPRDFIDSTLSAPGDTDAFKYLTRIVNIDDVAARVFRSPFSKLDWFLQRAVYFYGYALDLRLSFLEGTDSVLNVVLPRPWTSTPFTWWDRQRLIPTYLPAEIHPEAIMAGPIDRKTADEKFTDNTLEYLQRYKNPDPHTYKTQTYFLSQLAQFCHKERIELIIVNMPITLENIRLLKPGGYIGYLQGLKEFAMKHDLSFFDLNDFGRYHKNDYHDSVHLNAFGGTKFFDDLADVVVKDKRLNTIVAMSAEHLAKHRQIAGKHSEKTY
ncbi:MAG: hypothetical protein K2W82_01940 [Candidatus Obscuribacterales bacterium]|nr:hypothetical protein [Candidatus Obscuribacterales bacterium]